MWTRKRLIYGLITAVVVVLIFAMVTAGGGIEASTSIIKKTTLTVTVRSEGQTRVVDSYVMASPVSGELGRISAKVGDVVSKGSTLFRVSAPVNTGQAEAVLRANLEAAEARVGSAQMAVLSATDARNQMQTELKRQKALHADGIITSEQLERVQLNASSSELELESTKQALKAAEADVLAIKSTLNGSESDKGVLSTSVLAPTEGRVLRIFERNQIPVAAGTPILEIGNTRLLELVVDVLSEDAVRILPGQTVDISGWGGETLTGRVWSVEPAAFTKISALGVEEQRVNVLINFDSIPDELGVGYRVEAAITVQEVPSAIATPVSAIFQESGVWYVYAVVGDKVEKRVIEIATRAAEFVEVVSGLQEGDEVVKYPSAATVEGVKIKR